MTAPTLLLTVDSLRYDHYRYMEATREFLGDAHPATFATNTATPSCFQSIIGGTYPGPVGVDPDQTFVPRVENEFAVGVSTNRFLSTRYGYDVGFDVFSEPSRETGLKDRVASRMTPQSSLYKLASSAYNAYQSVAGIFSEATRDYRPADDVIDEFLTHVDGRDDYFGWLHFMEPHHPYNPDDAPVSRTKAQKITRRVLNGQASEREEELARELYRGEVEELDTHLERLYDETADDARVLLVADHGELLGEYSEWGHHASMCPEILRIPLATRNIDVESDVVSLVDVPTHLLDGAYGDGQFQRSVAYAASNGKHAAMNADHLASGDGVVSMNGDAAEDPELVTLLAEWADSADEPVTKDELPEDDLEALGYL